jgi:hypothetical protein
MKKADYIASRVPLNADYIFWCPEEVSESNLPEKAQYGVWREDVPLG